MTTTPQEIEPEAPHDATVEAKDAPNEGAVDLGKDATQEEQGNLAEGEVPERFARIKEGYRSAREFVQLTNKGIQEILEGVGREIDIAVNQVAGLRKRHILEKMTPEQVGRDASRIGLAQGFSASTVGTSVGLATASTGAGLIALGFMFALETFVNQNKRFKEKIGPALFVIRAAIMSGTLYYGLSAGKLYLYASDVNAAITEELKIEAQDQNAFRQLGEQIVALETSIEENNNALRSSGYMLRSKREDLKEQNSNDQAEIQRLSAEQNLFIRDYVANAPEMDFEGKAGVMYKNVIFSDLGKSIAFILTGALYAALELIAFVTAGKRDNKYGSSYEELAELEEKIKAEITRREAEEKLSKERELTQDLSEAESTKAREREIREAEADLHTAKEITDKLQALISELGKDDPRIKEAGAVKWELFQKALGLLEAKRNEVAELQAAIEKEEQESNRRLSDMRAWEKKELEYIQQNVDTARGYEIKEIRAEHEKRNEAFKALAEQGIRAYRATFVAADRPYDIDDPEVAAEIDRIVNHARHESGVDLTITSVDTANSGTTKRSLPKKKVASNPERNGEKAEKGGTAITPEAPKVPQLNVTTTETKLEKLGLPTTTLTDEQIGAVAENPTEVRRIIGEELFGKIGADLFKIVDECENPEEGVLFAEGANYTLRVFKAGDEYNLKAEKNSA